MIFGEDLAALLGLVFALVAIVVTMVTGNPLWDALGTLAIGEPGAANAGLLAAQILALGDSALAARLDDWRARQTASIPETPEGPAGS